MPIYAYACDECGLHFEKRQKFSEKPLTRCPECKGQVRRLIQPVGIVFKGSGWYITDSRRSSSATVSSSGKSSSEASSSESGSSESGRSESGRSESGSANTGGSGNGNTVGSGDSSSKAPEKT